MEYKIEKIIIKIKSVKYNKLTTDKYLYSLKNRKR
jgi:hypothetical protein